MQQEISLRPTEREARSAACPRMFWRIDPKRRVGGTSAYNKAASNTSAALASTGHDAPP
jgi:hypothetical protein